MIKESLVIFHLAHASILKCSQFKENNCWGRVWAASGGIHLAWYLKISSGTAYVITPLMNAANDADASGYKQIYG